MWGTFPSLRKVIIRVLEIAGAGLTSALVAYVLGRAEPPPPTPAPAVVHLAPADEEMIRTVRSDQAALLDQLRNNADPHKAPTASAAPSTAAASAQPASQPLPPLVSVTDVAVSATDLVPSSNPPAANPSSTNAPPGGTPAAAAATAPAASVAPVKPPAASAPAKAAKTASVVRREPKPELKPDAKPATDPMLQRPAAVAPAAVSSPQAVPTEAPVQETETGLIPALKGFTGRLLPSRDRLPVPQGGALRPPAPVGEFQQSEASGGVRGAADF
jgi:hypothetical protein